MSYTIIWERAASEGLKRLRARDGDAVKPLVKAISALAHSPEPAASSKLGTTNLRRLRVGVYRATYGSTAAVSPSRSSWSAVRPSDRGNRPVAWCAIVTRADFTATGERLYDQYIPVRFLPGVKG